MIVKNATDLIGNTPMLEIDPSIHGLKNINLYAKLELLNPFGSVKDKTAWNMLKHDLAQIKASGQTVIEASSGNTAKAMQMICAMHDIPFRIVTNRVRVREVKEILQLLGTEIDELPGQSQCLDPTDPNDPLFVVEKIMSQEPGKYFHTSQYTNERNLEAHIEMTGREIAADLDVVDYFVGGLGTTGSTRGAGEYLKSAGSPQLKSIGIVCTKGGLIPGIRNSDEMHEVGLFERDFYDEIIEVSVDEAIDSMLTLVKSCGVLSGPTGGSSLAGALKFLRTIDDTLTEKKNAVFLVCDRAEWYLSYMQKYRPELFGMKKKDSALAAIDEAQCQSAPSLDPDKAENWLKEENVLILDLRGSLAFKGSHIEGSVNIPQETFEELCSNGTPVAEGRKVLFVCPVGDQSRKFAAYFSQLGFDCASLQGGFVAWRDRGKPTIKGQRSNRSRRKESLATSTAN